MHLLLIILKKELTDTLRDRKTLFSAIFMPAISLPLILYIVTNIQMGLIEKESEKELKIALIDAPDQFKEHFIHEHIIAIDSLNKASALQQINLENIDAVLEFDADFRTKVDSLESGQVNFSFKSTNIMVKKRVGQMLKDYEFVLNKKRIMDLQLKEDQLKPMIVREIDIASQKEQLGDIIGGFIPYLFILFCFVGCMYPSLDLITGEKERGTIETLLTVPTSRFIILLGKTMTIAIIGVVAALMTLAGLMVGLNFMPDIPAAFMTTINDLLSMDFIILLILMLIPLSLFFGGLLSAIVVRASSYKEAQSYVTPMSFMVILPAMIAMMPGIELTWVTSMIPITNVALATKEIVAGTLNYGMYAGILSSLLLLSTLSVFLSFKSFSKESNLLK